MSRTAYFGIGIAGCLLGGFWCIIGVLLFVSYAVARDSAPGASLFDASSIACLIFWSGVFLLIIWGAFWSFKRALRPPPKSEATKDGRVA